PVSIPQSKGRPDIVVSEDEHPRPESNMDSLVRLKPLFRDGVTTAGNSSGINDGAAAMIVASRAAGEKGGCPPPARLGAWGVAGVPPRIMGFVRGRATQRARD